MNFIHKNYVQTLYVETSIFIFYASKTIIRYKKKEKRKNEKFSMAQNEVELNFVFAGRESASSRLICRRGSRSKYGNTKLNAVKGGPIMSCLLSTIISQMSEISTKLPTEIPSPIEGPR